MQMKTFILKSRFLFVVISILVISVVNTVYSMNNSDEESRNFNYSSHKDQESDSENDSDDSNDERIAQLVRAEIWGPMAEKLLVAAMHRQGLLDPLQYDQELRMLLDIAIIVPLSFII